MKKLYLAYGSNLNLEQMAYRCPTAKKVGKFNIKGYRLVFKGARDDNGYLTIEPYKGGSVPMGLFTVTDEDIANLDRYEGYPFFYHKEYLPIGYGFLNIKALVYVMNDNFDYHTPSGRYLNSCHKGYMDFGFNPKILEKAFIDTAYSMMEPKTNKSSITK